MLCENCGKNPANIVFTQVVNGEKTVKHLCQECMGREEKEFAFSFLGAMAQEFGNVFSGAYCRDAAELQCDKCSMTWSAFQKSGEVGCAQCYASFREQLMPVLQRVHGNARHAGKTPSRHVEEVKEPSPAEALRSRLGEALQREEYEEAARIRDELRAMETGGEMNA